MLIPPQLPSILLVALVATPLLAQEKLPPTRPGGRVPVLRERGAFPDPTKRRRGEKEEDEEGRRVIAPGAHQAKSGKAAAAQRASAKAKADAETKREVDERAAKKAKEREEAKRKKAGDRKAAKDEKAEKKKKSAVDGAERFRKGRGYFNFEKAELIDVVKQISKLTRKNFIIPERLKTQKITIICEKPVSTADAYLAFLAALEINNLNLIPTGKFYKIDQRKDSVRQPVPTLMDGEEIPPNDALVTAILELNYIDVDRVQKVVQNLMSKDGTLQALPPNMMILADSGANILRIQRILDKIDIEGSTNQIHIVDVQYAAASDIAQKLQQLFEAP
ncbi:MAG: hypothetical protein JRI68_33675, partial [Deltaproteobacteria bacterium]|nr:hypothetical protein [Deltaproteobacteria bacterium]